MKQLLSSATIVLALAFQSAIAQTPAPPSATPAPTPAARGGGQGKSAAPSVQATPEELSKIKEKTAQIEALVKELKAKRAAPELVTDVEVYAYAGKMLLEYPEMFGTQAAIEHAFVTLDQGIERGQQLQSNQPQWNQGRKQIHAYTSEIDGAVLPYGVTLPDDYDPTKPTRLYSGCTAVRTTPPSPSSFTASLTARGLATLPSPTTDKSSSIASAASTELAGIGPAKGTSSSPSPP